MAVTLKGAAANATWGVPDAVYSGTVVSCGIVNDGEVEPLANSNGETEGVALLDERDELQVEIIAKTGVTKPDRGDDLTIDSVTGMVLRSETLWENKGWKKFRVNGTKWHALATVDDPGE